MPSDAMEAITIDTGVLGLGPNALEGWKCHARVKKKAKKYEYIFFLTVTRVIRADTQKINTKKYVF